MTPHNAPPWPGWTPQKTLVLPIPRERWPPPSAPVSIDGITFQPKRELHVTLVSRGLGQALHGEPGRRGHRVQSVRQVFSKFDWDFSRTGEMLRLEKRELAGRGRGRVIGSIIEHIDLPALPRFYDELAELLERRIAIPPPHVTLYTSGRAQGIAVPDVATLQRLTVRQVDPAELEEDSSSSPNTGHRDRSRPRQESRAQHRSGGDH